MSDGNTMQEKMQAAEEYVLHTYNRFPVVFERGEGVYLYDTDGKRYLDFAAGIGVNALGYHYPGYDEALTVQIGKLMHISNLYYNEPLADAAAKICKAAGMDRVFFTNSGTEAVEGAIKTARKYAYGKDGHTDHEIIAFEESFHGRTFGSLSVTGTAAYREPFAPMIGGVSFATYNDIASVKACVSDKTCAILMETVQGEGGIHPADPSFLKEVRALCDEKGLLLILDEIQCGMGRCGAMFAYQNYGIKPDIVTSAKGLGAGMPVGAFLMTETVAEQSLVPGDHGTTYGGNPLALSAVSKVLDLFSGNHIIEHVQTCGAYLTKRLDDLVKEKASLAERRGVCLMQGLQMKEAPGAVIGKALDAGLVILSAGGNVIRLLPPLIIEERHVDEMIAILGSILD